MKKITINENGLLKINLGFLGDNYKNLKKTLKSTLILFQAPIIFGFQNV